MNEDYLNRDIYAKEIVEEIDNRYNYEKNKFESDKNHIYKRENLVFAISGKWGEGKSTILDLMEKPLRDKNYIIIRFNPWKYSDDSISIKRAFLQTVSRELKLNYDLDDLYFDKTNTVVNTSIIKESLVNFFVSKKNSLVLIALSLIVILLFIDPLINHLILNITIFFIVLILSLPVVSIIFSAFLLPIIAKSISISKKSATIKTSEQFEEKFKILLKDKVKIVIFVDDLDRCSVKTVKIILDAIKTFFLHPECSFVITGDHTIIERYAGEELPIEKEKPTPSDIKEAGRRFLKKLFDVYWSLPKPTPYHFGIFIDKEIAKSSIKITLEQKNNIKKFLLIDELFETNLRYVKRFLKLVSFTLDCLELKKKELKKELKVNKNSQELKDELQDINDILENPDLLAKVLLIEEFFYPLYNYLQKNSEKIPTIEKELRKVLDKSKVTLEEDVAKKIDDKEIISIFLDIISQNPQFTDSNDNVIWDPSSFFLQSGSTGLPNSKGPDEINFIENIKNGQLYEKSGKRLIGSTKPSRNEYFATKALEIFDSLNDPQMLPNKKNIIYQSLKLGKEVKQWSDKLDLWFNKIFTFNLNDSIELYKLFIEILLEKRPLQIKKILEEHPDLKNLFWEEVFVSDIKKLPENTINILFELIKNYIKPDSLELEKVERYLQKFPAFTIYNDFIKNLTTPDLSKTYIEAINKITTISEKKLEHTLKKHLEDQLSDINQLEWIANNKEFLMSMNTLDLLINNFLSGSSSNNLLTKLVQYKDRFNLSDKHKLTIESKILERINIYKDFSITNDPSIQSFLTPQKKIEVFKSLTNLFMRRGNMQTKVNHLDYLSKLNTFWNNVDIESIKPELITLRNYSPKITRKIPKFKEIIDLWLPTIPQENKN